MKASAPQTPPSPEELRRQFSDFIRQHLQGGKTPSPEPDAAGEPVEAKRESKTGPFEFNYKPREVKEYLDRFVIRQDEAKKVLSVALCDHYHHVRLALAGNESAAR